VHLRPLTLLQEDRRGKVSIKKRDKAIRPSLLNEDFLKVFIEERNPLTFLKFVLISEHLCKFYC